MKKNSQKRKFGTILLCLAALFAVLFSTAACKTNSDEDELNSVTISPSEVTINANEQTSLFAKVDKKGSGTPVYKWEITSGREYAKLEKDTSSTCVVTGNNTTASAQSVKVKCTVKFASTTKYAEATVIVSAANAELKSVSIAGSAEIGSKEETDLTATPAFTVEGVSPVVTYTWKIIEGSDYAKLSSTTGSSVTLTGNNTTAEAQTVTVKVSATYAGTTKKSTKTVKILAEGQTVENKVTSVTVSAEKSSIACDGNTTLTAKAEYSGNPEISYTWEIIEDGDYATLSESKTATATLTAKNATTAEQTVKIKVTAFDGTNSVEANCAVTVGAKATEETTYDINVVPGASVTTYGWADVGNMAYPNTNNIIYIGDDGYKVGSGELKAYTSSQTKRLTFTNAIASGSVSNSKVNETSAIIILSGTVDLSDGEISDDDHSYYDKFDPSTHKRMHGDITYEIGSNKTILGVNTAKIAFGGLKIYANKCSRENIIIRNIIFWDAHGSTEEDTSYNPKSKASVDNLVLECNGSTKDPSTGFITYSYVPTNIWIDHCVFTDGTCIDLERNYNHDGSLDMKAGKNVTVSYCEFTNHDKVTLLAPGDTYVAPEQRQITFHHNYYHDAVQRMPRSRGCQLHIYNNYYNAIGTDGNGGYALGPGIGSQFIVEGNYFGSFKQKIVQYADSSTSKDAATLSKFYQKNNNKTLTSDDVKFDSAEKNVKDWNAHNTNTPPWEITYNYKAEDCSGLPVSIPNAAGTDKSGYSKIIRVNGAVYGN
ncbi:pectate lyase family protein [Treponema sp.]|uniref:pectate lyase family protein n=1 Tax=Treponema sp. TaxID=166 RepID=UPI003FD6C281